MADGGIQPSAEALDTFDPLEREHIQPQAQGPQLQTSPPALASASPTEIIIWTPRFFLIFALTLVLGLSAESLLTEGWLNHLYPAPWALLVHCTFIFACWIALIVLARSLWMRIGGVFACIWTLFMGLNFSAEFFHVDPTSAIPAHLNAIICCALLGSFLCFSSEHTLLQRWDMWFFRLALFLGITIPLTIYLILPAKARSISTFESDVAATALVLCILLWWLRPSCWKMQPGPTFLFGAAPMILLLLAIPNAVDGGSNFFLTQVYLLCYLLGAMRILQGEVQLAKHPAP